MLNDFSRNALYVRAVRLLWTIVSVNHHNWMFASINLCTLQLKLMLILVERLNVVTDRCVLNDFDCQSASDWHN